MVDKVTSLDERFVFNLVPTSMNINKVRLLMEQKHVLRVFSSASNYPLYGDGFEVSTLEMGE